MNILIKDGKSKLNQSLNEISIINNVLIRNPIQYLSLKYCEIKYNNNPRKIGTKSIPIYFKK